MQKKKKYLPPTIQCVPEVGVIIPISQMKKELRDVK